MQNVNVACINKAFSAGTIARMDPSYIRLMEAAKEATAQSPQPVHTASDLARHMNESPQRIHNWKLRGVSKEGALKAEALYGVSANHILDGVEVPRAPGPPPPPRDFSDRHEVSETDWGLLQDVHLVMSDQELEDLRARAERTRRIAHKQLESVASGAGPTPRPSERTVHDQMAPNPARRHTK